MRMQRPPWVILLAAAALLAACGDAEPDEPDARASGSPTSSPTASSAEPTDLASPTPPVADAAAEILGEPSRFRTGGQGAGSFPVEVNGRECGLTETLFGSCRASTGAGGSFVVTAESTPEAPSDWNVVVRCGLDPAVPAASAMGTFQPMTADLGLEPYGEVVGVTMTGDVAEAALVYLPAGSECPVVWSLGEIDRSSLFTGGIDALNGESSPIAFRNAQGEDVCAVADGQGGISVSRPCP